MALSKKGTRQINVDGEIYRWKIRRKPTYEQALAHTPLLFAVEKIGSEGAKLAVSTNFARPDNWSLAPSASITPSLVVHAIHGAKQQGWQPDKPGSTFQIQLKVSEEGDLL